jgi:hypothetical protein
VDVQMCGCFAEVEVFVSVVLLVPGYGEWDRWDKKALTA